MAAWGLLICSQLICNFAAYSLELLLKGNCDGMFIIYDKYNIYTVGSSYVSH